MLLYGDAPSAGEPTLELYRRAVAADGVRDALSGVLERWGWAAALDDVDVCATTVLHAVEDAEVERLEVVAFRRAHQLTVELHCFGGTFPFHQVLGREHRVGIIDTLASLWGVRPLNDGEAVWFEFTPLRGDG